MKRKNVIGIFILVISLFVLSACGGSSSDSATNKTYSLDVEQSTNGNVNVDPDKDLYSNNEKVTISAETQNADYNFAYWQGSIDTTKAKLDLIMNNDMVVKPVFGTLDYEDDFSDKEKSNLYINNSDSEFTIDIINNKYIMSIDDHDSKYYMVHSKVSNSYTDEKYLIKYQARFNLANGVHGFKFNSIDWENHYLFIIDSDGFYKITKVVDGSYKDIVDWEENRNINSGKQVNQIAVKKIENEYTFYINDEKIDSVLVDFSADEFGDYFYIETWDYKQNEVEFDNFKFITTN